MYKNFWVCTDPTCADSKILGKSEEVSLEEPLILSQDYTGKPLGTKRDLGKVKDVTRLASPNFDYVVTVEGGQTYWLQASVL